MMTASQVYKCIKVSLSEKWVLNYATLGFPFMTADQVFDCEKFLFLPWMKWNPSFADKYKSVGLKILTFWRHYNLYKQGLNLRIFSTIDILVFMPYIWVSSYITPWSMFINAMYLSLQTNDFHPLTMTKVYSETYHKIYVINHLQENAPETFVS